MNPTRRRFLSVLAHLPVAIATWWGGKAKDENEGWKEWEPYYGDVPMPPKIIETRAPPVIQAWTPHDISAGKMLLSMNVDTNRYEVVAAQCGHANDRKIRWIPVGERLPVCDQLRGKQTPGSSMRDSKPVLVSAPGRKPRVAVLSRDTDGPYCVWVQLEGMLGYQICAISHWAELPHGVEIPDPKTVEYRCLNCGGDHDHDACPSEITAHRSNPCSNPWLIAHRLPPVPEFKPNA